MESNVKRDSEKILDFLYENPELITEVKEKLTKFEDKNETFFTWQVRNTPTSLHKQFKSTCSRQKKSMRDTIVTMMRNFVKENN
jgi:1,4-alpha-glucan branching enzyme